MARRGRDLFELLRDRGSGRTSSAAAVPASAPRARRGDDGGGFFSKLAQATRTLVQGEAGARSAGRRGAGASRAAAATPKSSVAGMALVAVAAIALLAGFVLGRFSVEFGGASRAGLRAGTADPEGPQAKPTEGNGTERAGLQPEHLRSNPAPSSPALSKAQEEVQLSNLAYLLLKCPARDRERAASAAAWLRDQGMPNARIRQVGVTSGTDLWYLVLCYTSPEAQASDLERLRGLDLPTSFDRPGAEGSLSSLRDSVSRLEEPFDLSKLKRR